MALLPEPEILLDPTSTPEIPLPKGWTGPALLGVHQAITLALARVSLLNVFNRPDGAESDGLRVRVENDRLRGEVGLSGVEDSPAIQKIIFEADVVKIFSPNTRISDV